MIKSLPTLSAKLTMKCIVAETTTVCTRRRVDATKLSICFTSVRSCGRDNCQKFKKERKVPEGNFNHHYRSETWEKKEKGQRWFILILRIFTKPGTYTIYSMKIYIPVVHSTLSLYVYTCTAQTFLTFLYIFHMYECCAAHINLTFLLRDCLTRLNLGCMVE